MSDLTVKQLVALRAVADPGSPQGTAFWHDARASWQGPRQTLGSLLRRGLVDYEPGVGWSITDAGLALARKP